MIKCIVGKKGSGKTKQLIDAVNTAVHEEHGSVICIECDKKLIYDINHSCRLIEIADYPIKGFEAFFGFICGMFAQNYDISYIFVDSLYRVTGESDPTKIDAFMKNIERFSENNRIKFTFTVSESVENVPASITQYM
jgi:energy-coupling factor transporter ATP-binding protein EcfA2